MSTQRVLGLLILFAVTGASSLARQPQFPAFFVENHGQGPANAQYVMRRPNGTAFFYSDHVAVSLAQSSLEVRFVRSSATRLEPRKKLAATANFFEGGNSTDWRSDVSMYSELMYRRLWPGINAIYNTSTQAFKSEFRVESGADPRLIRWNYGAQARVSIQPDGSLMVRLGDEVLREGVPLIYQEKHGFKTAVKGSYSVARNGDVGFEIGAYDSTRELVIDPVIVFTSLLGGSSPDAISGIATDNMGNIIVAGWTSSTNFPVMSASHQPSFGGSVDAFVAKFGGNGTDLIFCTFLGGNGDDRALGIATDTFGNIYLTGHTASSNFPLASALQTRLSGSQDAFVTKLNPAGTKLIYSTYLGGSNVDTANAIAVDGNGAAYIGGDTSSTDLPIVGGVYHTNQGGQDGFIAKLTAAGTAIVYSTYLGGAAVDHIAAISVNSVGNAYVTGGTFSINFPTVNAVQATTGGNQDAFVAELQPAGNALVFSTYLGGNSGYAGLPEQGQAIAVDAAGDIYVAGTTSSNNFPVTSATALQPTFSGGNQDAFLAQYSPGGAKLNYSSFLGGSGLDYINGLALNTYGYVTVTGNTSSVDFPIMRAAQKALKGSYDAFVAKYLFSGSSCIMISSTYLGGSGSDTAVGVALNGNGDALIAGYTGSYDFPNVTVPTKTKSFQTSNLGLTNSFVAVVGNPFFAATYTPTSAGPLLSLDYAHDGLFDGENFTGGSIQWGNPGDIPILGDWNGSGTVKVGVFRNGLWILDSNGNGILDAADRQFTFGQAGDIPVVGDWNGTGVIKAGVFRQGTWILDLSGLIAGSSTGLTNITATYGTATDIPVVGDWTGTGNTKIGIFREGFWILDANGDYVLNSSDPYYLFGQAGDTPLTGDWDGSGISHPGIVRNNHWFLNYLWDNELGALGSAGQELKFTFGQTGSIPMIGKAY